MHPVLEPPDLRPAGIAGPSEGMYVKLAHESHAQSSQRPRATAPARSFANPHLLVSPDGASPGYERDIDQANTNRQSLPSRCGVIKAAGAVRLARATRERCADAHGIASVLSIACCAALWKDPQGRSHLRRSYGRQKTA